MKPEPYKITWEQIRREVQERWNRLMVEELLSNKTVTKETRLMPNSPGSLQEKGPKPEDFYSS